MTLQELPYDLRLIFEWGQRQLAELLGALPRALGEIATFITRSTEDAITPMMTVLSQGQQEILVTAGIVTGVALGVFVAYQAVLFVAPRRRGATVRLRHRHH
jgi:hypothetical protein